LIQKIKKFIRGLPVIAQLINILGKIGFSGFPEVSLLDVILKFKDSLISSRISMRAAAVSYNFFMAIFPSVIFLFTLTAYLPIEDFEFRLLNALQALLPPASYQAVRNTILDIISQQRDGLLSFGALFALFYSVIGVKSVIESFNSSSLTEEKRPLYQIYIVSLALTFIIIVLLVLAIGLMIFTNLALDFLISHNLITYGINYWLILAGKWIIFYALIFFSVASLYYLGPPAEARMRFFSIGAWVTTFLMLLLIIGFGYFVKNFGTYNTLYGSVGALIALLVLINLCAMLLLAGYEFNLGVKHVASNKALNKASE
jgi:membrane protein